MPTGGCLPRSAVQHARPIQADRAERKYERYSRTSTVVKLAELEIACAREHVAYIPESAAGHDFVDGEAKLLVEHGGGLAAEEQLVRRVREDDERSQPVLLETANGVRAPGFESILDDQELLSVTLGSSTVLDFETWSVLTAAGYELSQRHQDAGKSENFIRVRRRFDPSFWHIPVRSFDPNPSGFALG